jgi:hypothetical protein
MPPLPISLIFESTAMGLPETSSMRDNWDSARLSSRCACFSGGISEVPQKCFGCLTLGKMTKGIKP